MDAPALPASARFALWFSAWVAGAVSLDDARDAIVGDGAVADVTGLDGSATASVPLIVALGLLRNRGASSAGLALPVPGDPVGLGGPPAFNADCLEAGQGVVLEGSGLGLVPRSSRAGVAWQCRPATSRRPVPDPSEADTMLRQAVIGAADRLADLDVARWRPAAADELMALRRPVDLHLPAGLAPRAVSMTSLAVRCLRVVGLARTDDGGAVSAREIDQRRAALNPLDAAARRALVAACSMPWSR